MQILSEKTTKNKYKNDTIGRHHQHLNHYENNKNICSDVETSDINIKRKGESINEQCSKNEIDKFYKRSSNSAPIKSKYIDGESAKHDYIEEEYKTNSKNEYRKRKFLKETKCSRELRSSKDGINSKNGLNLIEGINSKDSIKSNYENKLIGYNKGNSLSKSKSNSNSFLNSTFMNSKSSESKIRTFKVRAIWTFILIIFYFLILAAGHFYCSLLVLILVTILYREIISLKSIENKDKRLPQIFYIRWYWFFLTIITLGIPWAIPKLEHQLWFYSYLIAYHFITMFILAFLGFAWFILSLRKYSMKYQFSQIGIILLSSLYIVAQSLMHIANIYSGLIWFMVPVSSVVVNDIFAYVFGVLFGRTKLIELSPKKTVEGFVGSSIITILWGIMITYLLQNYKFFICPQAHISFKPFSTLNVIDCEKNPIFQKYVYTLPNQLTSVLFIKKIYYTKMIFHGLVLSLFAAFLAPFGGFFASGFKRALKIKDFGKYIPGHGGVTDRFDCQILIGMFTYIYMKTFAKKKSKANSYYSVLDSVQKLDNKDALRLYNHLKTIIDDKIDHDLILKDDTDSCRGVNSCDSICGCTCCGDSIKTDSKIGDTTSSKIDTKIDDKRMSDSVELKSKDSMSLEKGKNQ